MNKFIRLELQKRFLRRNREFGEQPQEFHALSIQGPACSQAKLRKSQYK